MIVKGSIIEQVKEIDGFNFIGEKFEVIDVSDTTVVFRHNALGQGVMSFEEMMKYFKVVVDEWSKWTPVTEQYGITPETALWITQFADIVDCDSEWQFRTKDKIVEARYMGKPSTVGQSKCSLEDQYDLETGIQAAVLKAYIECLRDKLEDAKYLLEEYSYYEKVDYSQYW